MGEVPLYWDHQLGELGFFPIPQLTGLTHHRQTVQLESTWIRTPPPLDHTAALRLGTYGDPRGVGVSCERGTPLLREAAACMHAILFHMMSLLIRLRKPTPPKIRQINILVSNSTHTVDDFVGELTF